MFRLILFTTMLLLVACRVNPDPQASNPTAKLELSDTSLTLEGKVGERPRARFVLTNLGDAILRYQLEAADAWLGLTETGGSLEANTSTTLSLTLFCDTEGQFESSVRITSNGGNATLMLRLECLPETETVNPVEPEQKPSSLNVMVTGLPEAAQAQVTVSAGAFEAQLSTTTMLENLRSGLYEIRAETVLYEANSYTASVSPSQLELLAGETKSVAVIYSLQVPETGNLALTVEGLAEGADIKLFGAFETTLTASQTLSNLAPGRYDLEVNPVTVEGATFRGNPNVLSVEVVANETARLTVVYACASLKVRDAALDAALKEILGQESYTCKDLEQYENLNLGKKNITSLSGLRYATNLKQLSAYQNPLTDITDLRYLSQLERLNLHSTALSDLSPLASLPVLRFLFLHNTSVKDLSPLSEMKSLRDLVLSDTLVSDLSPLKDLTELSYLDLNKTTVSDIRPLENLASLGGLALAETKIPDISSVQALSNLVFLDVSANNLTELGYLKSLTKLEELYAEENSIKDISVLSVLPDLTYLYLAKNEITDITALRSLSRLKELSLTENSVSDLSPLMRLEELELLSLQLNCLELNAVPTRGYFESLKERVVSLDVSRNPHLDCETRGLQKAIVHTFSEDAEGWDVSGSPALSLEIIRQGASSYLQAEADSLFSWRAPSIYQGDARDYIGKYLSFDVSVANPEVNRSLDVILQGAGIGIIIAELEPASQDWKNYRIQLDAESFGLPGRPSVHPTQEQFRELMADLRFVNISPNMPFAEANRSGLDNVWFGID